MCKDHQGTGLAKEMRRELTKLEREVRAMLAAASPDDRRDAGRRFQRKVERGDFAALFAGKMQALFDDQDGEDPFEDEIAALRVAMMRLLLEENDPTKLAKGLSQVSNATARLMRAAKDVEGEAVTAAALERSLTKLEAATREMTEDELREQVEREWKRAVGWTKEMEMEWRSPENQRRLMEEGIAEAREQMSLPPGLRPCTEISMQFGDAAMCWKGSERERLKAVEEWKRAETERRNLALGEEVEDEDWEGTMPEWSSVK